MSDVLHQISTIKSPSSNQGIVAGRVIFCRSFLFESIAVYVAKKLGEEGE